jgi:putative transposase
MYRLLAAQHGSVTERRAQREHPAYAAPELLAQRPNEVYSWDITKLKGPAKWTYYYLYVVLDVFSRYAVGWTVQHRESSQVARELIAQTCQQHNIQPGQLTVHADRGSSMTSKPVAFLLADLGVTKTHNRPYTSTDNPYSEAQFKTLKYRPGFPGRFDTIEHARAFCREFFDYYNNHHRHKRPGPDDPRRRPLRPRPAATRRPRPRARGRLRRPARALRRPTARPTRAPQRRMDQQARQRGGRSLNLEPNRLIRLDRLRDGRQKTDFLLIDGFAASMHDELAWELDGQGHGALTFGMAAKTELLSELLRGTALQNAGSIASVHERAAKAATLLTERDQTPVEVINGWHTEAHGGGHIDLDADLSVPVVLSALVRARAAEPNTLIPINSS